MQVNVGFADRLVRTALGVFVLAVVFLSPPSPWPYLLVVPFGVVPLLTGIFGICPLYAVLGVNTCGRPSR